MKSGYGFLVEKVHWEFTKTNEFANTEDKTLIQNWSDSKNSIYKDFVLRMVVCR